MLPETIKAPLHPELSVYQLSVCHQLHCLDRIRLSAYPEYFTDERPEDRDVHRDHCLDYIRQTVMCNADLTLDFFTFEDLEGGRAFMHTETMHQCRNFDQVREWAIENRLKE